MIASVERRRRARAARHVFPGFVDLQIYDVRRGRVEQGVTGYLATVGTSARGVVERFLADLPADPACLGAHVEGPYLNPEAAGAQALEHIRPVDPPSSPGGSRAGSVRMITLAPEVGGRIRRDRARSSPRARSPSIGHTAHEPPHDASRGRRGRALRDAHLERDERVTARAPGAVGTLLEDERVTLGLIADGRHLHPATEELTVRAAGPRRIALTSDMVAPPQEKPDGKLLGGDRLRRSARKADGAGFGLAEAATMASLVPAQVLGLGDRGRLAPGYRADLAVLDADVPAASRRSFAAR